MCVCVFFLQVEATIGLDCTEAIHASAKAGIGIKEILEVIARHTAIQAFVVVADAVCACYPCPRKFSTPMFFCVPSSISISQCVFRVCVCVFLCHSRSVFSSLVL